MNENGKTAYDILGLVTGLEATEAEIKKLEQAYRVLTDLQARGALDDLLRAKMQRQARRSSENDLKRKMRDELEQREKQAPAEEGEGGTVAWEGQYLAHKLAWHRAARPKSPWLRQSPALSRQYTADELRRIFSTHGSVQDVVVRESRRKSSKSSNPGRVKASALVVLASPEEVARAANSLCGDLADPLLVLPLAK
ncbi:J domain-containing protein, partial [Haematococcus lacustris]